MLDTRDRSAVCDCGIVCRPLLAGAFCAAGRVAVHCLHPPHPPCRCEENMHRRVYTRWIARYLRIGQGVRSTQLTWCGHPQLPNTVSLSDQVRPKKCPSFDCLLCLRQACVSLRKYQLYGWPKYEMGHDVIFLMSYLFMIGTKVQK